MTPQKKRTGRKPPPRRQGGTAAAGDSAAADESAAEALAAASAPTLALAIDPAWRAGVARNLRVLLAHAALVDAFPLADEIESAPVFRA